MFGFVLVAIAVKYGGEAAPALLLGLPLAGIFSLVVLWQPRWGVAGVFAGFALGDLALSGTPLDVVEALALIVAVLVALQRLGQGQTMLPWVAPLWWGVALICWSLVSLESAISTDLGVRQILQLAGGMLFACVIIAVSKDMRDLRWVLGSLTAVSAFIAAIGLTNLGNMEVVLGGAVAEGRLNGAFDDPNQLGAFAAMTLFPAIGLIGGCRTKGRKLLVAVAIVLIGAALLLSLSRGAWVGVLVGFIFLVVTVREFRRLLLMVGIPVLIVAAALGAFAPDAPQVQVVQARLKSFTILSPYDAREQIWAEGWREMNENPLTGVGPGSFPVASIRSGSSTSTVFAEHAHSILFTWGAETGVPGVLVILGFIVSLAVTGRRAIKAAARRARTQDRIAISGIAAGLVSVAGHGIFDYNLRNMVIHLTVWALIGALLASYRIQVGPGR
jgi:O-antigen ligase